MILEQFNNQYKYQTDKDKFRLLEAWAEPKLQSDGFYYGDCEDYCIFLRHNIEEFEDWEYYYCKILSNNKYEGHCILSNGTLAIDCNIQNPILLDDYITVFKAIELRQYTNTEVQLKFLASYLQKHSWFNSLVSFISKFTNRKE
jgi:predicted transglutaminase-like cysteine proteinase